MLETHPSKHDTVTQCCFDVGPTSKQHWVSVSCLLGYTVSVFHNKLKIPLDSRSCKLEAFTRPKKHHQTVGGQWPIVT